MDDSASAPPAAASPAAKKKQVKTMNGCPVNDLTSLGGQSQGLVQ